MAEQLEMIKKTITIDPTKKEQISKEPDFKSLHANKEFQKLLE